MTDTDESDIEHSGLDRNEYQADCDSCGEQRTARVDGAYQITRAELEEKQRLWCENCESDRTHTVVVAGGDYDE